MQVEYVRGMLGIANVFIALFILLYSLAFLVRTKHHRERRPWELLFVATLTYLLFQVLNNLFLWGVVSIQGVDVSLISRVFEFIFSGLVLLAFLVQHDLILRSSLILIMRKGKEK
ncbi:hypothetical protein D6783_01230 [Candidatus Woesearchaeota archaeon]|nr:MAG: hypothetical protein D6783_01230 [Candidatus Woesearchaeota archaeon]